MDNQEKVSNISSFCLPIVSLGLDCFPHMLCKNHNLNVLNSPFGYLSLTIESIYEAMDTNFESYIQAANDSTFYDFKKVGGIGWYYIKSRHQKMFWSNFHFPTTKESLIQVVNSSVQKFKQEIAQVSEVVFFIWENNTYSFSFTQTNWDYKKLEEKIAERYPHLKCHYFYLSASGNKNIITKTDNSIFATIPWSLNKNELDYITRFWNECFTTEHGLSYCNYVVKLLQNICLPS